MVIAIVKKHSAEFDELGLFDAGVPHISNARQCAGYYTEVTSIPGQFVGTGITTEPATGYLLA